MLLIYLLDRENYNIVFYAITTYSIRSILNLNY